MRLTGCQTVGLTLCPTAVRHAVRRPPPQVGQECQTIKPDPSPGVGGGLRAYGACRSLFRGNLALPVAFDLVHTAVGQLDQVAPVFATFGL